MKKQAGAVLGFVLVIGVLWGATVAAGALIGVGVASAYVAYSNELRRHL